MKILGWFFADEAGAITVDWVTLTAGILLAGLVAIYSIYGSGVANLVTETSNLATASFQDIDVGPVPAIN